MNIRRTDRRASDLVLRFEATRCRTGARATHQPGACMSAYPARLRCRSLDGVPVDARPIDATGGAHLAAVSIAEVADLGRPAVGAVMPMDA